MSTKPEQYWVAKTNNEIWLNNYWGYPLTEQDVVVEGEGVLIWSATVTKTWSIADNVTGVITTGSTTENQSKYARLLKDGNLAVEILHTYDLAKFANYLGDRITDTELWDLIRKHATLEKVPKPKNLI